MSHEFLNLRDLSHEQLTVILVGGLSASALFLVWLGYLGIRDRKITRKKLKRRSHSVGPKHKKRAAKGK